MENIILTKWYGKTFSHTDLMKWPCLAVKACQQHKYLIVLYMEKLLKHNINRMRGLIKLLPVFQHGFLKSEENVDLHNFSTMLSSVGENVNLHKFQHFSVRCCCESSFMQW